MRSHGLSRRRAILALIATVAGRGGARAEAARRVVSLDDAITETLIVLGRPPVAVANAPDWARWVVEPPLPEDVINIGSDQDVNFELLASLTPDLILTTPYLDAELSSLERIAPCRRMAIDGPGEGRPLERAAAATRVIGGLVGAGDRAEALIRSADARFARDSGRLGRRSQFPFLMVNFLDARHLRVYGDGSLWRDVLDRMGLVDAWTNPTNAWGFSTVGVEALAALPAATLVVFDPVPPDALPTLDRSPLWQALPALRGGGLLRMPPISTFGALPAAMRFSRVLVDRLTATTSGD